MLLRCLRAAHACVNAVWQNFDSSLVGAVVFCCCWMHEAGAAVCRCLPICHIIGRPVDCAGWMPQIEHFAKLFMFNLWMVCTVQCAFIYCHRAQVFYRCSGLRSGLPQVASHAKQKRILYVSQKHPSLAAYGYGCLHTFKQSIGFDLQRIAYKSAESHQSGTAKRAKSCCCSPEAHYIHCMHIYVTLTLFYHFGSNR